MAAPINRSPPMQVQNLEALLKMAPPIRDMILRGLSNCDLDAFDIALGKGTTLQSTFTTAFQAVKKQITQKRNELLLQEILMDHPEWKNTVEPWKISLEDKIWLLQLYELRNLGIDIPLIDFSAASPDLLKSKQAITEALAKVTEVQLTKNLLKCPRAIGLLVNLQTLNINSNSLKIPPDVSQNVNLKYLWLCNNSLTTPPDVRQNVRLESLEISGNELTVPPDIRRNVKLKHLNLGSNKLTVTPDISQNVNLQYLYLYNNQLTVTPDISRNVHLQSLSLENNKLKFSPDISKNVRFRELNLMNNPLTSQAKKALFKLQSECSHLSISFN